MAWNQSILKVRWPELRVGCCKSLARPQGQGFPFEQALGNFLEWSRSGSNRLPFWTNMQVFNEGQQSEVARSNNALAVHAPRNNKSAICDSGAPCET